MTGFFKVKNICYLKNCLFGSLSLSPSQLSLFDCSYRIKKILFLVSCYWLLLAIFISMKVTNAHLIFKSFY